MSPVIDGGMRSGIPREEHSHVVTYYGNIERYRDALMMDDLSAGYAFLLDRDGMILWQGRGFATEATLRNLLETAKKENEKIPLSSYT